MSNLVAVYGSLRQGLYNHYHLEKSEYITNGVVKGFGMYSLGAYPTLTRKGEHTDVVVEVYNVTGNTFVSLDALEGYPTYYNRKQVRVDTPDGPTLAWIYYMKRKISSALVLSGDWKKYLESQ